MRPHEQWRFGQCCFLEQRVQLGFRRRQLLDVVRVDHEATARSSECKNDSIQNAVDATAVALPHASKLFHSTHIPYFDALGAFVDFPHVETDSCYHAIVEGTILNKKIGRQRRQRNNTFTALTKLDLPEFCIPVMVISICCGNM